MGNKCRIKFTQRGVLPRYTVRVPKALSALVLPVSAVNSLILQQATRLVFFGTALGRGRVKTSGWLFSLFLMNSPKVSVSHVGLRRVVRFAEHRLDLFGIVRSLKLYRPLPVFPYGKDLKIFPINHAYPGSAVTVPTNYSVRFAGRMR